MSFQFCFQTKNTYIQIVNWNIPFYCWNFLLKKTLKNKYWNSIFILYIYMHILTRLERYVCGVYIYLKLWKWVNFLICLCFFTNFIKNNDQPTKISINILCLYFENLTLVTLVVIFFQNFQIWDKKRQRKFNLF